MPMTRKCFGTTSYNYRINKIQGTTTNMNKHLTKPTGPNNVHEATSSASVLPSAKNNLRHLILMWVINSNQCFTEVKDSYFRNVIHCANRDA